MFIVGCEEGVFPSSKALNNPAEMEEERRCMYVAITRAQDRLYLTSAGNRYRFGKVEYNIVSRFVEDTDFRWFFVLLKMILFLQFNLSV